MNRLTALQVLDLVDDNILGFVISSASLALEEPKEIRIVVAEDAEPESIHSEEIPLIRYETEDDERVCPICEDLDADTYLIDDDQKPVIPDDTHPNCRCYYVFEETGEEVSEEELSQYE